MDVTHTLPPHALQTRQSPLHARLAPLASEWREANAYQVVTRVGHAVHREQPWLADLSHCARIGFKGRGSASWLAAQGVNLPAAPNQWLRDTSGAVIARLGAQDFLVADDFDIDSGLPQRLAALAASAAHAGAYLVPRQHGLAMLALGGKAAPQWLARLCAVDLDGPAFGAETIAQTQVALVSTIVMRGASPGPPGYRLLVDTSLALYLWDVLHEVAAALGGAVVGEAQIPRV